MNSPKMDFLNLKVSHWKCTRYLERHTCVSVHLLRWCTSNLKTEIEWQKKHWAIVSELRLATTNTCIDKGRIASENARPQASHWYRFVINYYFAVCNNFNDALTYLPFFSLKCCESVVLYIILLEVSRNLSCFCKMASRSKVVGPRCARQIEP